MRLRNKPWAAPLIEENPKLVTRKPIELKGKWQSVFAKSQPLAIEIGSGKGQFIIEMAKRYPERNFLSLERQTSAVGMILQQQIELQLPNLFLILGDGGQLADYFESTELTEIFLNFSDPWPKTRHEKRRLTAPSFLNDYAAALGYRGKLQFKTDNQGLFEYSLGSFNAAGWQFESVSLDLHQSEFQATNIQTEYEEKFSQRGSRIYQLIAVPPKQH